VRAHALRALEHLLHARLVEDGGINILEAFELGSIDLLADEALDVLNMRELLGGHDRECVAGGLRAAGAANTVHVVLGMLRHVVVDDVADARDVDAARGDVGRDHHFILAALEALERVDALLLGAIAVQRGHGVVLLLELAHDAVRAVFRARENEDAVVVRRLEEREQQVELLVRRDRIDRVSHALGGRAAGADLDFLGIAQAPGGQALDFVRDRRGIQQRLPILLALVDDAAHVGQEAHVEHAVHLVENEDVDLIELDVALLHEVEQAARRGADDVHAFLQFLALLAVADTAEKAGDADVHEACVVAESGLHLHRQLTRRLEHETARMPVAIAEAAEHRQREGAGFARARLGRGDEVLALEHDRKRTQLNRAGINISHALRTVNDGV